jgi:uncharacterized protein YeaO (DUF488 family)
MTDTEHDDTEHGGTEATQAVRRAARWENEGGHTHRPAEAPRPPARPATVRVGRVYDPPSEADGTRVLVDRLWPRGMSKTHAALDEWCKQVAPSPPLRKWYDHDPQRFEEFGRRYRAELREPGPAAALEHLGELATRGPLRLLTATKQLDISEAAVLVDLLRSERRYPSPGREGQPK